MLITLLTIVFAFISILITILVMLQPSQGEGFASAFTGSSANAFFGTKALSVVWKATIVLAGIFFILAIVINKLPREYKVTKGSISYTEPVKDSAPDNSQQDAAE